MDVLNKMMDTELYPWLRWPESHRTTESYGLWSDGFAYAQTRSLYRGFLRSPDSAQWPGKNLRSWCIWWDSGPLALSTCCLWRSWVEKPRFPWRGLEREACMLNIPVFGLEVWDYTKQNCMRRHFAMTTNKTVTITNSGYYASFSLKERKPMVWNKTKCNERLQNYVINSTVTQLHTSMSPKTKDFRQRLFALWRIFFI